LRPALPARRRASLGLPAHAGDRRRRDGGDQPPAGDARGPARPRGGRQRRRRRARGGGRAPGRRAKPERPPRRLPRPGLRPGRAPAVLDQGGVDRYGPRSVTVPGAVAAWFDLAGRYGRLSFERSLERAAALAEAGVAATARVATLWQRAEDEGRAPFPAPTVG